MDNPTTSYLPDILRSIVLLLALYSVYMTLASVGIYWQRIRFARLNFIAYDKDLAKFVYLLTVGHILMAGYCITVMYVRFGLEMTWRTPYFLVTFIALTIGEYFFADYQRKQFNKLKATVEQLRLSIDISSGTPDVSSKD